MHQAMSLQEIWSEVVATLKSKYNGLKGGSDGVEKQRLAFIQQWLSSPFLELSCLKETMPINDIKKYTKAEIISIDTIYPFQVVMFCDRLTISLASTTSTNLATHNHNHGLNASRIIEYATIRIG